jgi:hypothetical protein
MDFETGFVLGSCFRVEVGAGYAPLLYDEDNKITVIFKV